MSGRTGTKPTKKAKIPRKKRSRRRVLKDPSEDVFGAFDNILDHETPIAELLEKIDQDEEIAKKHEVVLIKHGDEPPPEPRDVIELLPYFNNREKQLYTEALKDGASIEYDIQICFRFIASILAAYDEDPGQINRDMVETKILALMDNISIATAPFWSELSCSKDIISYKLNQRLFPTFMLLDKSKVNVAEPQSMQNWKQRGGLPPPKKVDGAAATTEPSQQQKAESEIRERYDLGRPTLRATLNRNYVDEAVTVTDTGVRRYMVLPTEKYTSIVSQDTIDHIFRTCAEHKLFAIMLSLFCRLCSSREFCHLALNSPTIMNLMFGTDVRGENPFLTDDYQEILHHFMFYGFYLMYKEECTVKSMASPDHRFVLDLEAVQRMPIYDGPLSDNPYIPLTLSSQFLYATQVPTEEYLFKPLRVANAERGVYALHSVQERFTIFTDGIFDGINWDKLTVTGSMIPACVIRNPLERLFGIKLPRDVDLNDPNAARDYWQNETNRQNLRNYFDEYYPSKNILNRGYLNPDNPLYGDLTDATERLSDIDVIVDATDDVDFDKIVLEVFERIRINAARNHERDPERYPSPEVKMLRITTDKSYKYYIVGPALHKNIELFRIFVDPLGCISRFHFPCVRGAYKGNSVKLFPSLVSAAYTGVLLEYKWMSSAKDTKDLVCKYYTRGFNLVLNPLEHVEMKNHVESNPRWHYIMNAANNSRSISLINPIFKPRQNRTGLYAKFADLQLQPSPIYQFSPAMANFDDYWEPKDKISRHGFPLGLRYPAGHIRIPELWKIGAYVYDLRTSKKYRD